MKRSVHIVVLFFVTVILGFSGPGFEAPSENEHLVMAVLWYQLSAERRALCYQAFQTAKLQLDRDAEERREKRPGAVVVDIDETVLDNSPHTAKMVLENKSFPYAWTDWVNAAKAEPLPGAVEFLDYAVSKGYDVFYVSNRSAETELDGTIRNLRNRGFPEADHGRILLRTNLSGKEARRQSILVTHDIVLLIGDNLNDHAEVFEKKPITGRFAATDSLKNEFGTRFIVLPNPMYGEWENAVYRYQRGLSQGEKADLRRSALQDF